MEKLPGEQLAGIRDRTTFSSILRELTERKVKLQVDPALVEELNGYLQAQKLLPQILNADNREEVSKAQDGLFQLQGRLDRVASVHLTTRRVLRGLNRLEILAKSDLFSAGIITERTSKPAAEQIITLYLPELATSLNDWDFLERLCRDVQDHLGDAKEALALQMKLDGNHHWAQRVGA